LILYAHRKPRHRRRVFGLGGDIEVAHMKYLSLFSGIGGFELGIQQAYENSWMVDKRRSPDSISSGQEEEYGSGVGDPSSRISLHELNKSEATCIGYSEIDKYAIKIYERHFPDHRNYGDIKAISTDNIDQFDLLVGGFPCQSFSIAGKRGGFDDTRGTLFFEIARILHDKQPTRLLLENVKGLLSHDNGFTFKTIISTLDELGYDLQWQVLNSKNHGVPQNRERVFIVGHLRGTPRPEVFPFGVSNAVNSKQNAQGNDIAHTLQCGDKHRGSYIQNPKLMNYKKDYENSVAITATSYKEPPTVNAIRRLTPTECERLQGLPDGWTEGVSDTQRYKCLGNAVTVNVVREIMREIIPKDTNKRNV